MTARVLCLIIGYCFGLFQTGYFYGKRRGVDIRTMGSGNAGTTNALRSLGLKAGLVTMAGDILKCILAVLVTWLIFRNAYPELVPLLKMYTAAGVVLGHDYPFYLHFKGGKGVAATAGIVIAFGDIRLIVVVIGLFFVIFFTTHIVSLASLLAYTAFCVGIWIFTLMGDYGLTGGPRAELLMLVTALTVLAYYGHRGNIHRLAHRNERKTYLRRKEEEKGRH